MSRGKRLMHIDPNTRITTQKISAIWRDISEITVLREGEVDLLGPFEKMAGCHNNFIFLQPVVSSCDPSKIFDCICC